MSDLGRELHAAVSRVLHSLETLVVDYAPQIVVALVLLVLGWIGAYAAAFLARVSLRRLGVDRLADRFGVSRVLQSISVSSPASRLLGHVVFVFVFLVFLMAAGQATHMKGLEKLSLDLLGFLPRLVAAVLLVVAGALLGQFLARGLRDRAAGAPFARLGSGAIQTALVGVGVIMALSQLGIDAYILGVLAAVGFAGLALTIALSFGMGSKDITRNILAGYYLRKRLSVGSHIEAGNYSGAILSIDSTQTTLQVKKKVVLLPNSAVFENPILRDED